METKVYVVDPAAPDASTIRLAADALRNGLLVAFPTETVYGLGASALDDAAVERIFVAKGRPSTNPIIVHVADTQSAQALVTDWPLAAERLAERFWPGPLTLVLPKVPEVPDAVTATGPTVAVRVPAHPVSQALLRAAETPIAAPSANRSTHLSPTRAEHVLKSLSGHIELLLDGGPCPGGIESTVLDLTTSPPSLLRPGLISVAALEAVVGRVETQSRTSAPGPARSPGMMERHYAPIASLEIAVNGAERAAALAIAGLRVGRIHRTGTQGTGSSNITVNAVALPDDPVGYAADIYAALHGLDELGVDRIVVDRLPDEPEWLAICNRLHRAAV